VLELGLAKHKAGKLAEAAEYYRRVLGMQPNHPDTIQLVGSIACQLGQYEVAVEWIGRAIRLDGTHPAWFSALGQALARQGKLAEALSSHNKALELKPNWAPALHDRGDVLRAMGLFEEALANYDQALAGYDASAAGSLNLIEAYLNRATVLAALNRSDDALASYNTALALCPESEGEAMIRRALARKPDQAEPHFLLGAVLLKSGRTAEAEASLRLAVALKPDLPWAYHNLSVALMELGRLSEAREAAKAAIALAPEEPALFRQLGELRTYEKGDPYFSALEAFSRNEASFDDARRVELHFALAKAYADTGRFECEFTQLQRGNRLARSRIPYDEAAALAAIDRARQAFTAEFVRAWQGVGDPSTRPIFIVGMPRSGTSLIEQILASHSGVTGAGELPLFEQVVAEVGSVATDAANFPDIVHHLSEQHFRQIGQRYLAGIQRLAPAAVKVIDKMPTNFLFAGLIHLALPNAIIIHAVRDPLDTCLSMFSKLFRDGNFQAYDLAELGRYYRSYQTLVAHWRQVLPAGRMLDVRYEDLVANPEGQARRIVDRCGLSWEPRCLDFHQTERVVRTASAVQVRKPIFTSSIGRWRAYQPFLGPLLAELAPLL